MNLLEARANSWHSKAQVFDDSDVFMAVRAFISGCAGVVLSAEEQRFCQSAQPWGLILFKRNVESPEQLKALTASFRAAVGRADAPVLIDQEGGRVQRMGPPHWPTYAPAAAFNALKSNDIFYKREMVRLSARLMAHDLREVGIDVDCLPVLDVPIAGSHNVIGNRAYAQEPDVVALLGRAAAEGLMAGGVMPVMKHIPGHGRAFADSHLELPSVDTPASELLAHDFRPFQINADLPAAMTAHVVYQALDGKNPATVSRPIIQNHIRGTIGFDGLLISDDLSMKALAGTFQQKAKRALRAGCDVVLHCNGVMEEMLAVAEATPKMGKEALRRARSALACTRHVPEPLDVVDARARLQSALAN